jgi:hypothetical protein
MMFENNLPHYFWRKNSSCSQKIKDYYQQKFTALLQMRKQNPEIFKQIEGVFWNICAKDLLNKAIKEERAKIDLYNTESITTHTEQEIHNNIDVPDRELKKNMWDILGE